MKRIWILIGSIFLGSSTVLAAPSQKTKPDMAEATPEADKKAAKEASSEADKWAASQKAEKAVAPEPEPTPEPKPPTPSKSTATPAQTPPPAKTEAAAPAQPAQPIASPVQKRAGLNEMRGKLISKSDDPKAIRVNVNGGFNVEFTYDSKTVVTSGGRAIKLDELGYDDEIVLRYAGKDLYLVELERVAKAHRPE